MGRMYVVMRALRWLMQDRLLERGADRDEGNAILRWLDEEIDLEEAEAKTVVGNFTRPPEPKPPIVEGKMPEEEE